jgi:hypothetical protein
MTLSRLLLAAAVVLAVLAFTQSAPAQGGAPPIGSTRIGFSSEHLDPNSFHLRAFVATDSASPNCLVTMNESNFAVPGMSVFCSPRTFNEQNGVVVSVFFPWPPPVDFFLDVTLYQEQAAGYASPVLYSGE